MNKLKCSKCLNDFKWIEILKSILFFYLPLECSNCESKLYIKFRYRLIISLLIAIPISYILINKISGFGVIVLYLLWGTVVLLLSPYYVKYYLK